MKIPVGKYVITSDPYQYIVNEKKISKKGKNMGKEYLTPASYHNTVESAMQDIIERRIRSCEATTIKELIQEVGQIKTTVKQALKGVI